MKDEMGQKKTPKYKLGEIVWTPLWGVKCEGDEQMHFVQCKVSGIVYSYGATAAFCGYMTTGNSGTVIGENGVFATREECEALIACSLPRPKSGESEGN